MEDQERIETILASVKHFRSSKHFELTPFRAGLLAAIEFACEMKLADPESISPQAFMTLLQQLKVVRAEFFAELDRKGLLN